MISHIISDIAAERARQDAKWGGPTHDDGHNPLEWVSYIIDHTARALGGSCCVECTSDPKQWTFTVVIPDAMARGFRKQMVRVAALAIAALEALDRRSVTAWS